MLERFRIHYPLGSLTSELIAIERGQYIVRASVQVDGVILGTGMAEASTIEQAEDRARERVLALLKLEAEPISPSKVTYILEKEPVKPQASEPEVPPPPPPPASPSEQLKEETPERRGKQEKAAAPAPEPLPIEPPAPSREKESRPPLELELVEPPSAPSLLERDEPVEEPLTVVETEPEPEPALPEPPPPAPQPQPPLPSEVMDFSEIITQSDVELKRLGWTSEQGRNYLIETYGKRSRQLLSDEELLEFLHYLQSQPTPVKG